MEELENMAAQATQAINMADPDVFEEFCKQVIGFYDDDEEEEE